MRTASWMVALVRWSGSCASSSARDEGGVDASIDLAVDATFDANGRVDTNLDPTLDANFDVGVDALRHCEGLDPAGVECAREMLRRLDAERCEELRACGHEVSDEWCAAYYPPEGSVYVSSFEDAVEMTRAGRLRFDLEAARCVLDANTTYPTTFTRCEPMFAPVTAPSIGAQCRTSNECGSAMRCSFDGGGLPLCAIGVCAPRTDIGGACTGWDQCGEYSICLDGTCRELVGFGRASEGAPCGYVGEGRAVMSITCEGRFACTSGWGTDGYVRGTCVPAVPEGGACGAETGPCAVGLACLVDACTSRVPREGDPCGGASSLCSWGTFGLVCGSEGRCIRNTRRLGELCASNDRTPCLEGTCTFVDDWEWRCLPETRAPTGGSCLGRFDCEDGPCCRGVCEAW